MEEFVAKVGVQLLKPNQYLDKWRLDRNGVRPMQNDVLKQALGFSKGQSVPR